MSSFLIKDLKKGLKIKDFDYDVEGFIYKPKNKSINEINIVNPDIISGLIMHNFNMKFKKILALSLIDDTSDSEDNLAIALNEIARLKSIMDSKYKKFLKKKEADKVHRKLMMAKKDIQLKIVDKEIRKEEKIQVEEKRKGR